MIDDNLELPATDAPAPIAGTVLLTGVLDGDGHARLLVTGDDGATCTLPPEAPGPAPACRLTSPGFHGPTISRPLVHGEHVAGCLDASPRDVNVGTALVASFRLDVAAVVGWAEATVYASNADNTLRRVATADIAGVLVNAPGTQSVELTTTAPIVRGETLWFALSVWVAAPQTMPRVIASAYPDPIASGRVLRLIGDAALVRPSQATESFSWDPFTTALPVAATVRIP